MLLHCQKKLFFSPLEMVLLLLEPLSPKGMTVPENTTIINQIQQEREGQINEHGTQIRNQNVWS